MRIDTHLDAIDAALSPSLALLQSLRNWRAPAPA